MDPELSNGYVKKSNNPEGGGTRSRRNYFCEEQAPFLWPITKATVLLRRIELVFLPDDDDFYLLFPFRGFSEAVCHEKCYTLELELENAKITVSYRE